MTDPVPSSVLLAEKRAADARRRLQQTVGTLQTRLDPRTMARDTVDNLAESGGKALRSGVETAKRHPGAIAGAAALMMSVLARKRIAGLFRRKELDLAPPAQPHAHRRVRLKPRPAPAKRNDP